MPVDGFQLPADHKQRFNVMEMRIGTDPSYALKTHKGTGYYKVPSLLCKFDGHNDVRVAGEEDRISAKPMAGIDKRDVQFDAIVNEVVSEAYLNRSLLLPEEIEYIREHALNKPLGVIHIWALGVGV